MGLEARLKYTKVNKDMLEAKTIVNLEEDLAALEQANGRYDPKIKEVETRVSADSPKSTSYRPRAIRLTTR